MMASLSLLSSSVGFFGRTKMITKPMKNRVGLTLENVESDVLGFAAKVVVADGGTTIVGDASRKELLNREAEKIGELVLTMTKETPLGIDLWNKSIKEIYQLFYRKPKLMSEIEWLDERLVRLYERVAAIEVDAESEKEVEERKQRFDVVLNKIKMAFKKGIVAGGGCTLDDDEHSEAVDFLKTAFSYPIKQIAKNAGVDENVVIEKVLYSDDPYYVLTQTSMDLLNMVRYRLVARLLRTLHYFRYLMTLTLND